MWIISLCHQYLLRITDCRNTGKHKMEDAECLKVRDYCQTHWPDKHSIESSLKPYWKVRGSLTLCDDLLLYNSRIVVPPSLRRETMLKIHEGHQGVERCRERVRSSVWWPGVTSQVKQFVENCRECAKVARPRREPLLPTPLPDYPWQVVGSDLFELKGEHYLLTVDYFSRYPEVIKLSSTTSSNIIALLKTIFARHGIPEVLRTDNGPQYVAKEFAVFAKAYGFQHITSSPRFPQSNGQVERMVQTIKGMLKNSTDPHLAVLSYRATPMPWCGLSPSELLMGRRIRTTVPQTKKQLTPSWLYLPQFKRDNLHFKEKQKENFDKHHRVREQSEIPDGSEVVITTDKQPVEGRVVEPAETPRSYIVQTPSGEVRRNRSQLNIVPERSSTVEPETGSSPVSASVAPRRIATRSQTGTAIRPPERLF